MTFCVAILCLLIGFLFGVWGGFESATKDIGRYGFFTWGGKKYDCTTSDRGGNQK
jgi:hypothetical protein